MDNNLERGLIHFYPYCLHLQCCIKVGIKCDFLSFFAKSTSNSCRVKEHKINEFVSNVNFQLEISLYFSDLDATLYYLAPHKQNLGILTCSCSWRSRPATATSYTVQCCLLVANQTSITGPVTWGRLEELERLWCCTCYTGCIISFVLYQTYFTFPLSS